MNEGDSAVLSAYRLRSEIAEKALADAEAKIALLERTIADLRAEANTAWDALALVTEHVKSSSYVGVTDPIKEAWRDLQSACGVHESGDHE